MRLLLQQYKLVCEARQALFTYLQTTPFRQLHKPVKTYNNKSVCYLLLHVAEVYLQWLDGFAMKNAVLVADEASLQMMDDVRGVYETVDNCVTNFISAFEDENKEVSGYIESRKLTFNTTVLALFTHVITHEFHHKGQILNITRQLGYIPADTDVIRIN